MKLLSLNKGASHGTVKSTGGRAAPWNTVKLLGQKPPLKLKEVRSIRIRLQQDHRTRELAIFNLAIDSKLRSCDLVGLRVHDIVQGSQVDRRRSQPGSIRGSSGGWVEAIGLDPAT